MLLPFCCPLRARLAQWNVHHFRGNRCRNGRRAAAPASPSSAQATAEALSALTNLGYAPSEAAAAVTGAAAAEPDAATPALIRAALRALAPRE